jgi:hypothetical protein
MPSRARTHRLAAALALVLPLALTACTSPGLPEDEARTPTAPITRPLPSYADVAAAYNARVAPLKSLFAHHVSRITYIDENGDRQVDQAEGTIQVVLPDHLAMSLGKAGHRVFWFGGDGERYWWFDLREERTAYIGRFDNFDNARRRVGITIHPLDLIRVLGIVPLPEPPAVGATQWSSDGTLLGVTTRIRDEGYQRLWLDPQSYEPRKIELFDSGRRLTLVADLDEYDHAEVANLAVGPRIATRINVLEPESGIEVRLTMDAPSDGARRISTDAFEFDTLRRVMGVERTVDLDTEQAMAPALPPGPAR